MTGFFIDYSFQDFYHFTETLSFNSGNKWIGFFGNLGTFTMSCNYETSSSTGDNEYQVAAQVLEGPNEIETFLKWNQIELNMFEDATFTSVMNPKKLIIGELFFINIEWRIEFSDEFPLYLYIENCLVQDVGRTKKFEIIQNGCTSDIVGTTLYSKGLKNQGK